MLTQRLPPTEAYVIKAYEGSQGSQVGKPSVAPKYSDSVILS